MAPSGHAQPADAAVEEPLIDEDVPEPGTAVADQDAARSTRHQLVRFLLVGATTWVIDTAIFLVLKSTVLDAKPVTAKVIAVVVATVVSYVLNRQWSFRGRGGRSRRTEATLFFVISAIAIAVYGGPLWISRYVLQLHEPVVSLPVQQVADFVAAQVVGVLLGTAFRWWALRRFVFLDRRRFIVQDAFPAPRAESRASSVSVVIPTRNERETAGLCVRMVHEALAATHSDVEILVVDDSDDGTPAVLADLTTTGVPVQVLHRVPAERAHGLSGAVTAGFERAGNDVIVVMDGDLQHPPEVVPLLVAELDRRKLDICIASRYLDGGSAAGLDGATRRLASLGARIVVHLLIPATRGITDPCGGFFAIRRTALRTASLQADGFKILVEVLARAEWSRCGELPYAFAGRAAGSSNFTAREVNRFLLHMARLTTVKTTQRDAHVAGVGD
jgi:putative flippase GtrA